MNGPLEIQFCIEDDVSELMHFIGQEWGRNHILSNDRRLLTWQFDSTRCNAINGGVSVLIAKKRNRIVGCLGLMPFSLNALGTEYPAAWLSTWLVAESQRVGSAGLQLLMRARTLGYDALFVVGINPVVEKIYAGLGFEVIADMGRWIGIYDPGAAARLFKETGCSVAETTISDCTVSTDSRYERTDDIEVIVWDEEAGHAWQQAWVNYFSTALICHDKSTDYLVWRYLAHPFFDYHLRVALLRKTGEAVGLAVYRVQKLRERPEYLQRISEFVAAPRAGAALANAVIEEGEASGAVLADFYVESATQSKALQRFGFRKPGSVDGPDGVGLPTHFEPLEPGHIPLITALSLSNRLRSELGALSGRDDLYLTRADGDQDRPNLV